VKQTNGRKPRTGDKLLKVQWANGDVSRWTFTASQLRFSQTGHPFDVLAVELVQ
jgi:hypothetical protein